jgi:hypothetical protein
MGVQRAHRRRSVQTSTAQAYAGGPIPRATAEEAPDDPRGAGDALGRHPETRELRHLREESDHGEVRDQSGIRSGVLGVVLAVASGGGVACEGQGTKSASARLWQRGHRSRRISSISSALMRNPHRGHWRISLTASTSTPAPPCAPRRRAGEAARTWRSLPMPGAPSAPRSTSSRSAGRDHAGDRDADRRGGARPCRSGEARTGRTTVSVT